MANSTSGHATGAPLEVLADRYELRRRIARGGMAEVFEGYDRRLGRVVAVKVLQDGGDPTFAERLRREAEAAARVASPHVVNVYDVGEDDGRPFLVMEYVDGPSLAEAMRRSGPMPVERAVAIANSVLDALDAAHSIGVVHRDVKPGNILLANTGAVKLSDFGIAMVTNDVRLRLTATNVVMGSPSYLAPERARGEAGSPRSDLYAVGVVLYEMLAGRTPFAADNAAQLALAHQQQIPVPVNEVRPDVPSPLGAVIAIAMAKDPDRRFRDASAMRTALARARTAEARRSPAEATVAIASEPTEAFSPSRTAIQSRMGPPAAAAAAIGAAGAVAGYGGHAPADRSSTSPSGSGGAGRPPTRRRRAPWVVLGSLAALIAFAVAALAATRDHGGNAAASTTKAAAPRTSAAPVATTPVTSTAPPRTTLAPTTAPASAATTPPTTTVAPTTTTRATTTSPPATTVFPVTVAGLISEISSADTPYRYGEAGQQLLDDLNTLQRLNPNSKPYRDRAADIVTKVDFWINEGKLLTATQIASRVHKVLDPVVT